MSAKRHGACFGLVFIAARSRASGTKSYKLLLRLAGLTSAAVLAIAGTPDARGQCSSARLPDSGLSYGSRYGTAVSIDGDSVAVGANLDRNGLWYTGSARVLVRTGAFWVQQSQLFASDSAKDDGFGSSVAISGDTVVVGSPGDDTPAGANTGSAYVFVRVGGAWTEQAHLFASDGAPNDLFGTSVALAADTLLVGASGDDTPDGGEDAGSAYVFMRSGSVWTEQARLHASNGAMGDRFGRSAALDADTAVIGADSFDVAGNGTDGGAAYVFHRSGGVWLEQAQLLASDADGGDLFGCSVSIDDDTAVVGAYWDSGAIGAAYVFERNGALWAQTSKLVPVNGERWAEFGRAVTIFQDTIAVGAPRHRSGGVQTGVAYVFARADGTWTERAKLVDGWADDYDEVGSAVALGGVTAIVGVPGSEHKGAAFAFDVSVLADAPQILTLRQTPRLAYLGRDMSISACACGASPLEFRWRKNGANLTDGPTGSGSSIDGATMDALTITNLQIDDSGNYDIVISNPFGTVTSQTAQISVIDCDPCDINCDGSVNGFDIESFLGMLTACCPPCSPCAGDTNWDGSLNGFDVDPLLNALLSEGGC
ncbi:MAG: hypothetical protein CHACPFDD_00212 [Phycisphaerae bacterium]|nr:hypothetical protein [Phycisphaerae bacterium]